MGSAMSPRPHRSGPRISVIVPTLNRRDDLLEFTDSLLAQTVRPTEFLVVDAGDVPDMEAALLDKLAGSGIGLVYRRSEAGTSLQRNVALALVTGDFVLLCDDDLLLEPDYIAESLAAMDLPTTPPVGCVLGTFSSPARPKGWQQRYFRAFGMTHAVTGDQASMSTSGGVRWLTEPTDVVQIPVASGGRTLYRAACFSHERFDEFLPGYTMAEDVELSWRVAKTWTIVQTPKARCYHKRAEGGRVDYGDRVGRLIYSRFYFFKKHIPKQPKEVAAFAWTNVGIAGFYTAVGLTKGEPGKKAQVLRGIARGYKRVVQDLMGKPVT